MNHETKTRWLAALESDDYQQCHCELTDGTGFCCLGVLAKIEGADFRPDTYDDSIFNAFIGERQIDDGASITLTDDFAAEHGLTGNDLNLLAALNDGNSFRCAPDHPLYALAKALSFEEIADETSPDRARFRFRSRTFREIAAIIRANF